MAHPEAARWLPEPGKAPAIRNPDISSGLLAMPAPVSAHDHGYGIRTLDFGCPDDALEPWITGLRLRPTVSPFLETSVAFGRLALAGCGATMHCHNSLLAERLEEEAAEVISAAKLCGIRLGLSCPLLDISPWVYGGPEALKAVLDDDEWQLLKPHIPHYRSIDAQIATVENIAKSNRDDDLVNVQFGPIGPQWCSNELLEAIADASKRTGLRIHMHLLESPRQRLWLDKRFPEGIVAFLDRIGFLSSRLAVAHGVQLRREEWECLADRSVTLVTNPGANLRLRSGIAPVAEMLRSGLPVALGLDGTSFDDHQDIWQEMRLLRLLHGGQGLDPDVSAGTIFDIAITAGARVRCWGEPLYRIW